MAFFVVTYTHPSAVGDNWPSYVAEHITFLESQLKSGTLRASGRFLGIEKRSAMLIISAADMAEARRFVEADPFHVAGVIDEFTITEWDPIFGIFQGESSKGHQQP